MESVSPIFYVDFLGYRFGIFKEIIVQWGIIFFVLLISLCFTSNLKETPNKKQCIVESFVEFINNLVEDTMGENKKKFTPYIGGVIVFLLLMNVSGLFGIEPPTENFSVTLGMAIITFFVIQSHAIKEKGVVGYFTGYFKPFFFLFPINVIERIMLPVSLSLRLFGNITAAAVIMKVIYDALGRVSWIAQIGIPIPLHIYFDIFDGGIQMLIFVMLTMINIKEIAEH